MLSLTSIECIDRGIEAYPITWAAMRAYTEGRDQASCDQIWFVQHLPVFTQGQNGKPQHILASGNIPIIQSDRGGQVTYHGPGQLIAYVLIDLRRAQFNLRQLISKLEQAVVGTLQSYGVLANTRPHAPGVYVNEAKICSLGLRIRHGYTYHGLALNIDMDLTPFSRIHPCGFVGMPITQIKAFVEHIHVRSVQHKLSCQLITQLTKEPSHAKKQPCE